MQLKAREANHWDLKRPRNGLSLRGTCFPRLGSRVPLLPHASDYKHEKHQETGAGFRRESTHTILGMGHVQIN